MERYTISHADDSDTIRQLAEGLGDLYDELTRRIPSLPTLTSPERERRARDGLAQLRSYDVLTDAEAAHLTTVVDSVFATEETPHERFRRIDRVHQELNATDAGPAALAIAGIASTNSRAAAELGDEARERFDIGDVSTPGECACAGAIVGATAGLLFGPAGVLAGAAAGAAGGVIGFYVAQELTS